MFQPSIITVEAETKPVLTYEYKLESREQMILDCACQKEHISDYMLHVSYCPYFLRYADTDKKRTVLPAEERSEFNRRTDIQARTAVLRCRIDDFYREIAELSKKLTEAEDEESKVSARVWAIRKDIEYKSKQIRFSKQDLASLELDETKANRHA